MKKTGYILFVCGISIFVLILVYYGIDDVFKALRLAGYGLFLVAASHVAPLLLDSIAWRLLFLGEKKPGYLLLMRARWIGESINSLLPAAQVGGDIVRARMLAVRGYPVAEAGASVFVEITLALVTQLVFALVGIALLLYLGQKTMIKEAAFAVAGLSFFAVLFILVQKRGFWGKFLDFMSVIVSRDRIEGLAMDARAMDRAISMLYSHKRTILFSCFWRLAGWFSGALEVWIALYFMGAGMNVADVVLLESLGQVVRGVAFLVPGAFGIQEGGFVILGSLVGLTPEIALGMSLAKRFRELLLGIPGLIMWQIDEGRLVIGKNAGS